MDRGIITISETGVVTIPTAPIWMTKFEIAVTCPKIALHSNNYKKCTSYD